MALADEIKIQIKAEIDNAIKGIKKTRASVKDLGKTSNAAFTAMKGAAAAAAAVIGSQVFQAAKKSVEAFANFDQAARASFSQFGKSADEVVKKLGAVSGGTVDMTSLVLASNRAMALGVTTDLDKMSKLMEFARLRAQSMGITTTQAFDDLVTGIGRGSPLILDNLGIITKGWAEEAKAAGEAYDAQFILNKVLAQAGVALEETGGAQNTFSEMLQATSARAKDFQVIVGQRLAPIVKNFLDELGTASENEMIFTVLERGALALTFSVNVLMNVFRSLVARIQYFTAIGKLAFTIIKLGAETVMEKLAPVAGIFGATADAIGAVTNKVKEMVGAAGSEAQKKFEQLADSTGEVGDAMEEVASAAQNVIETDFNGLAQGLNDIKNVILGVKSEMDDGIYTNEKKEEDKKNAEETLTALEKFLKFYKKNEKEIDAFTDALADALSTIGDVSDVIFERMMVRFDAEIEALRAHKQMLLEEENIYQQQLDAIENSELNERIDRLKIERDAAIAAGDDALAAQKQREIDKIKAKEESAEYERKIEEETAKKIEELEAKKLAAKRKAAIVEKTLGIFTSIVDTAVAVTKTLSQFGATPIGISLAAVAAAMGIAKTAAISATPIPQFAMGAPNVSRPTLAMIGEGSMSEAVVPLPDGRSIPVDMRGSSGLTVQGNLVLQIAEPYYDSWANNLQRYKRENGSVI